jgi:hypothetical protein
MAECPCPIISSTGLSEVGQQHEHVDVARLLLGLAVLFACFQLENKKSAYGLVRWKI